MSIKAASTEKRVWTIFLVFLRLGLTSFGGPIAHLGYFRQEFVQRRAWLSDQDYGDLVALCQFLPGPASSQVGLSIGLIKGGYSGAFAAWAGFTLPSALILILFALGVASGGELLSAGVLNGLKVVVVAVVAQALWGMGTNLCPDRLRVCLMLLSCSVVLLVPDLSSMLMILAFSGLIGAWLLPVKVASDGGLGHFTAISKRGGLLFLGVFFGLLLALPILSEALASNTIGLIDAFYRTGSLVFGGGHVVLPLLEAEPLVTQMVNKDIFLAGYGIAQAVPGPLFTFSAYLGASSELALSTWLGASVALFSIFLPSFLLIFAVFPFWLDIRNNRLARAALMGLNASVVGVLLAAFYDPVWVTAINSREAFLASLLALTALTIFKLPAWLVVLLGASLGHFAL